MNKFRFGIVVVVVMIFTSITFAAEKEYTFAGISWDSTPEQAVGILKGQFGSAYLSNLAPGESPYEIKKSRPRNRDDKRWLQNHQSAPTEYASIMLAQGMNEKKQKQLEEVNLHRRLSDLRPSDSMIDYLDTLKFSGGLVKEGIFYFTWEDRKLMVCKVLLAKSRSLGGEDDWTAEKSDYFKALVEKYGPPSKEKYSRIWSTPGSSMYFHRLGGLDVILYFNESLLKEQIAKVKAFKSGAQKREIEEKKDAVKKIF